PAPPAITCEMIPSTLRLPDCAAAVIAGSNSVTTWPSTPPSDLGGVGATPAKCLGGKTIARSQAEALADAMNLHGVPLRTARGLDPATVKRVGSSASR